jgi:purine-nucleoside phosphorylase
MSDCLLDAGVERALAALEQRALPAPGVLLFPGTGLGGLPARLHRARSIRLGELDGVPPEWSQLVLHTGEWQGGTVWMLEDAPGNPELGNQLEESRPAWVAGFPLWLAAAAGAGIAVHTSAGAALAQSTGTAAEQAAQPGEIGIVRDHINFSGSSPLVGLSHSRLGPLFPDQTLLFDTTLVREARQHSLRLGIPAREVIAACVAGPALETPAERRFWSRAGAQVSVQGLANCAHAAAHCGLGMLELVAVTDAGEGVLNMAGMVQRANEIGPRIEELIVALMPALHEAAAAAGREE